MSEIENANSWLVLGLSWSVLVLGFIMKMPQIAKVLKLGTTAGISLTSLTLEFWV